MYPPLARSPKERPETPVSVLTGFPGSGQTTVLNHLARVRDAPRTGLHQKQTASGEFDRQVPQRRRRGEEPDEQRGHPMPHRPGAFLIHRFGHGRARSTNAGQLD